MFAVKRLEKNDFKYYENFVHYHQRAYFHKFADHPNTVAIGAHILGKPVGLIWGELSTDRRLFVIFSVYVMKKFRGMSVGSMLLQAAEDRVKEERTEKMQIEYLYEQCGPSLEQLMLGKGWELADRRLINYYADLSAFVKHLDWIEWYTLPDDYEMFPWREVTVKERMEILNGENDWYPSKFTPFRHEALTDWETSVGLRYKGEIVGWSIIHRYNEKMAVCDSLFTREEFQSRGRAIPLLAQSILLLHKKGVEIGVFYVNKNNDYMRRFAERRLKEGIKHKYENRQMIKRL